MDITLETVCCNPRDQLATLLMEEATLRTGGTTGTMIHGSFHFHASRTLLISLLTFETPERQLLDSMIMTRWKELLLLLSML